MPAGVQELSPRAAGTWASSATLDGDGWRSEPGATLDTPVFMMIVGVYATLGVFLIWASSNPLAHRSLIWFTVWSSVVHAGIMAVQSMPAEHIGHLLGDVPALILVAIVLGGLLWSDTARARA